MSCLATPPRLTVLLLPGWRGSGPTHWQTRWLAQYPGSLRVDQRDWDNPRRDDWVKQIDHAVSSSDHPVFFVAHSLGCIAMAHWANVTTDFSTVAGALLVSPPWFSTPAAAPSPLRDFFPAPLTRLPFASTMVASENDPYISYPTAARVARAWGSELVSAGKAGHINVDSGHGDWPEGERLLGELLTSNAADAALISA